MGFLNPDPKIYILIELSKKTSNVFGQLLLLIIVLDNISLQIIIIIIIIIVTQCIYIMINEVMVNIVNTPYKEKQRGKKNLPLKSCMRKGSTSNHFETLLTRTWSRLPEIRFDGESRTSTTSSSSVMATLVRAGRKNNLF